MCNLEKMKQVAKEEFLERNEIEIKKQEEREVYKLTDTELFDKIIKKEIDNAEMIHYKKRLQDLQNAASFKKYRIDLAIYPIDDNGDPIQVAEFSDTLEEAVLNDDSNIRKQVIELLKLYKGSSGDVRVFKHTYIDGNTLYNNKKFEFNVSKEELQ